MRVGSSQVLGSPLTPVIQPIPAGDVETGKIQVTSELIQWFPTRVSTVCRDVSFMRSPGSHQGDGTQGLGFLDTSQSLTDI